MAIDLGYIVLPETHAKNGIKLLPLTEAEQRARRRARQSGQTFVVLKVVGVIRYLGDNTSGDFTP